MTRNPGGDEARTRSLLEMYALGEGTEAERRAMAERLAASEALRREYAEVERVLKAARVAPVPPLSPAYFRRREALIREVFAPRTERESVWTRLAVEVVSTVGYLRGRFRTSARFRFLVLFAAAQAVLIAVLAFGLFRERPPEPTAEDRWNRVVREDETGLREDGLEERIPEVADELRPGRIRIRPEDELPASRDLSGGWLASGDAQAHELFRTQVRQARTDEQRRLALVFRRGGGLETESAVRRGLRWLAARQQVDGSFAAGAPETADGMRVGTTGLALLALLGQGVAGAEREAVERGLEYLIKRQQADGLFGGAGEANGARLLNHALATQAVLEAVLMGVGRVPEEAVDKAIAGIRPDRFGDPAAVTQAGFTLILARSLGYAVDPERLSECQGWFGDEENRRRFDRGGSAALAFHAGQLLLDELAGKEPPDAGAAAVRAVLEQDPADLRTGDLLAWLHAAQALVRGGDEAAWARWNGTLVRSLVSRQREDGGFSWLPAVGGIGPDAVRSTAASVLLLQVYYRYGAL
ncbi:MAG: hypothetical protein JXQ29_08205 [Planctomycetes bacterium]|nr:hypothetical protein [Planctomycetota bacterium]